jgi:beta-lactam-binding protein with PASTA domain
MSGIFISYRRADSQSAAGRLADDLKERLPELEIFRDVETIAPGVDFVDAINRALASCGVLLAVIGPRWLSVTGPDGKRRLDDPADYTRLEVAAGLKRTDVRVIPVLVEGAVMPASADLPEDLKALARRNAIELTDKRWKYDVSGVEGAVRDALNLAAPPPEPKPGPTPGMWPKLAAGAGVLAVAVAAYVGLGDRNGSGGAGNTGGPSDPGGTVIPGGPSGPGGAVALGGGGTVDPEPPPERLVQVPYVVGQNLDEARRELAGVRLDLAEPERRPTAEAAPDTVLEQSPAAGTRIAAGEAVRLTVASAEAPARVPNLNGLELERAIEQLVLAGLKPGEKHLAPRTGQNDKANRVFSQSTDPDQELARGSRVDLWLWGDAVVMPNVIGYEARKARQSLESYGLRSDVKYAEIDTVKAGVVIEQDPEGDTEQSGRTVVRLTVAKAKPTGSTAPTVTLNPKVLEALKQRNLIIKPPAGATELRVNPDLLIRREIVRP